MAKMINMVVMLSTAVVRGGKRVYPDIGKSFPFTQGEIDTIKALHPTGLRKPVNESAVEIDNETAPEGDAKPSSTKTPKPKRGDENNQRAATPKDDAGGESNADADKDTVDEDEDI